MMAILIDKLGSTLHDFPYNSPERKCIHPWVINPTPPGFAMCRHFCAYCYARDAIYSDHSPIQKIYRNLPELVRRDLDKIDLCPPISIAHTTDPCQDVPELRQEVARLVGVLMEYGVAFSIITKGDPTFLLDLPGFADYPDKFVAQTIEGPPELLRLLSSGAPGYEERLGFLRTLSEAGVKTTIRLDPVILPAWRAFFGESYLDRLDDLADHFAGVHALHVVSSTGRISRRRPGGRGETMWERIVRLIGKISPAAADQFERDYSDSAVTSVGRLLRRDLRIAFHLRAKATFESRGLTYSTCQELESSIADSDLIPSCEGLPTPFSRKGADGRFHPIGDGCSANCHVTCRSLARPPCGQPSLAKPAPYRLSELKRGGPRRSGKEQLTERLI